MVPLGAASRSWLRPRDWGHGPTLLPFCTFFSFVANPSRQAYTWSPLLGLALSSPFNQEQHKALCSPQTQHVQPCILHILVALTLFFFRTLPAFFSEFPHPSNDLSRSSFHTLCYDPHPRETETSRVHVAASFRFSRPLTSCYLCFQNSSRSSLDLRVFNLPFRDLLFPG